MASTPSARRVLHSAFCILHSPCRVRLRRRPRSVARPPDLSGPRRARGAVSRRARAGAARGQAPDGRGGRDRRVRACGRGQRSPRHPGRRTAAAAVDRRARGMGGGVLRVRDGGSAGRGHAAVRVGRKRAARAPGGGRPRAGRRRHAPAFDASGRAPGARRRYLDASSIHRVSTGTCGRAAPRPRHPGPGAGARPGGRGVPRDRGRAARERLALQDGDPRGTHRRRAGGARCAGERRGRKRQALCPSGVGSGKPWPRSPAPTRVSTWPVSGSAASRRTSCGGWRRAGGSPFGGSGWTGTPSRAPRRRIERMPGRRRWPS